MTSDTSRKIPKPLEIDLRGKTVEEVVKLLQENGFHSWSDDVTELYDGRTFLCERRDPKYPVYVVWICPEEADLLTVTIFDGKTMKVPSYRNLHFYTPTDKEPGGWGIENTGYLMK